MRTSLVFAWKVTYSLCYIRVFCVNCTLTHVEVYVYHRDDFALFLKLISQPKHPWCKKVAAKNLKKGHTEDVKSKWAAKASCC